MRGLDPRIHDEVQQKYPYDRLLGAASWIAGSSPAMTGEDDYSAAVFAGFPIAAFTRGMTSSAINCSERLASAGSAQSMPA
jgi:hypothetical protein